MLVERAQSPRLLRLSQKYEKKKNADAPFICKCSSNVQVTN